MDAAYIVVPVLSFINHYMKYILVDMSVWYGREFVNMQFNQQRLQTMCALYVSKSRAGAKKHSTLVLGSVPPPSPAIIDSARLSAAHCIPHESRSLSRDIHSIASISHNKPYPRKPRKFLPTVLIPFGTPRTL